MAAKDVRIGCSGWVYRDWRGRLYPEGVPQRRWLEVYAESFPTVEVNSTFYRLASPKAVEGWVESTPEDFVFSVKMSRYVSHLKRLRHEPRHLEAFYAPLGAMSEAGKLGPVLWQFPENFHRDEERLARSLDTLPPGRHCFEFRHASWFTESVYELLRAHDAALVLGDDPERPEQKHVRTASWTYVRFHRGSRGRRGNYSPGELRTWARRIGQWRRDSEVFAYFNNDWSGFAPDNAATLSGALGVGRAG